MSLTATLRHQHAEMRALLEDVRRHGIASAEGRQRLAKARDLIVDHLRREDAELYPALRSSVATQAIANTYADEMQELSREIVAFFDAYRNGGDDLAFARGFGRLLGTLNQRWTREEVRLYPAYETHCASNAA
ncbi:MAG: hemerythrin domain-containing protein [Mizugakiibacter sp.]|uniref:hemerythrin domain-containing protein n=1 Tax=Mizugakiibacter sp. TaxID=1972610 RepID=UPI0031BDC612|nr:hemerythrin domain-containing protein [Xanthomonadaceae bacterium]